MKIPSVATGAVLLILPLFTSGVTAQKGAKRTIIEVTSTLADLGSSGHPLLVQSDRKGPYVSTVVKNVRQVDSILIHDQYGTDWSLTTYYVLRNSYVASDRSVFFNLAEQVQAGGFVSPILGTAEGLPVERGYVTSHLTTKCSVDNIDMLAMASGATVLCPGSLRFRAPDGLWYRFSFQPNNFERSEKFSVTCTRGDITGCREWRIVPSGTTLTGTDPNPKSLHTLLQIDDGGSILAVGGDYLLSFAFTVTR